MPLDEQAVANGPDLGKADVDLLLAAALRDHMLRGHDDDSITDVPSSSTSTRKASNARKGPRSMMDSAARGFRRVVPLGFAVPVRLPRHPVAAIERFHNPTYHFHVLLR